MADQDLAGEVRNPHVVGDLQAYCQGNPDCCMSQLEGGCHGEVLEQEDSHPAEGDSHLAEGGIHLAEGGMHLVRQDRLLGVEDTLKYVLNKYHMSFIKFCIQSLTFTIDVTILLIYIPPLL